MIPKPIATAIVNEAISCLVNGKISSAQLTKFKNAIKNISGSRGIFIEAVIGTLDGNSDLVIDCYERTKKHHAAARPLLNMYFCMSRLGLFDLAHEAANTIFDVVSDSNINDLVHTRNILIREGLVSKYNIIVDKLDKLKAKGNVMKYELSNYNISEDSCQSIIRIAKDTCLKSSVTVVGFGAYEIDSDGLPTLDLSIYLNCNDHEKIAELQWELNGAIVDYNIKNKLDLYNVVVNLWSAHDHI